MSVYTEVERDALIAFLESYAVGELLDFEGISEGIENTNYFVNTTQGRFVLTLFEQHPHAALGYFLAVMDFFYQQGVPSAHAAYDRQGRVLNILCEKPAALVVRLSGRGVQGLASLNQCRAIGHILAKMHTVAPQFAHHRHNGRGHEWRVQMALSLAPSITPAHQALLSAELEAQAEYPTLGLPSGVCHADLFRDNALFDGEQLQGIIDFYYACDDYFLYDLAVTVNDWCVDANGRLDPHRFSALIDAYQAARPLSDLERLHWPLVARAAALRFWLSRLQDQLFPKVGEMTHIKDPENFRSILEQHHQQVLSL